MSHGVKTNTINDPSAWIFSIWEEDTEEIHGRL